MDDDPIRVCRRCGRTVESSDFEVFERMHYVCFHYEFEHGDTDIDVECGAGGCPARIVELRYSLRDWTDWDVAAFKLGRAIGLFTVPDELRQVKGVFWTGNAVGGALHRVLLELVAAGVLDRRDEPDEQFRFEQDWRRSSR